jgi:achromobactin ABC superfamily ATP binding cassette transporter, ABC protein
MCKGREKRAYTSVVQPKKHYLCKVNRIEINHLTIGYRHREVASNLSACLKGGCLTCLIGRNGLGKTTLLRTLAGFQPALSGEINLVIGEQSHRLDVLSRAHLSRLVSVVLTEKIDVTHITVNEMVGMGRMPYTGFWGLQSEADRLVVSEALRAVGISSLAQRDVSTLSDGERQKVMIAKAQAQQTPVVLLDEPTAFLDYPSKVNMMKLLAEMAHEQEKIVLLSTHDLDIALRYADQLLTMDEGLKFMTKDALSAELDRLK